MQHVCNATYEKIKQLQQEEYFVYDCQGENEEEEKVNEVEEEVVVVVVASWQPNISLENCV